MQEPPAGAKDVQSSRVDLLVSLGERPAAYVMPDLQGLPLSDAEARITTSGLKLEKLNVAPYSNLEGGLIAGQTPAPGSRVESGAEIDLQVSE